MAAGIRWWIWYADRKGEAGKDVDNASVFAVSDILSGSLADKGAAP